MSNSVSSCRNFSHYRVCTQFEMLILKYLLCIFFLFSWLILTESNTHMLHRLTHHNQQLLRSGSLISGLSDAIKECVENSVDAHASSVECSFDFSCLSFTVKDNGEGILPGDLSKLGISHFSSKTDMLSRLDHGFKGVSLNALSMVSNISVFSMTNKQINAKKIVRGESLDVGIDYTISDKFSAGDVSGTIVEISDLFYCLPVRKQYMLNNKPSFIRSLKNFQQVIVFAHPETSFRFTDLQSGSVDVFKSSSLAAVLPTFAGTTTNSVQIDSGLDDISINGVISDSSKPLNLIYFNNKLVRDDKILSFLNTTLKKKSYVLKLKGQLQLSDLMQDPSKTIHSLSQSPKVIELLKSALGHTISSRTSPRSLKNLSQSSPKSIRTVDLKKQKTLKLSTYFGDNDKVFIDRKTLKHCRVVSQIDKKFILIRTAQSLMIVDQHACDERINVESLYKDYFNSVTLNIENQYRFLQNELESPLRLDFSKQDIETLKLYQDEFQAWGINYFAESQSITVTHLPELLLAKDQTTIHELLISHSSDLLEHQKLRIVETHDSLGDDWWNFLRFLPQVLKDLIDSKACRSAIMFGDKLTIEECEKLIENLKKCKWLQCAHGRPCIIPLVSFK